MTCIAARPSAGSSMTILAPLRSALQPPGAAEWPRITWRAPHCAQGSSRTTTLLPLPSPSASRPGVAGQPAVRMPFVATSEARSAPERQPSSFCVMAAAQSSGGAAPLPVPPWGSSSPSAPSSAAAAACRRSRCSSSGALPRAAASSAGAASAKGRPPLPGANAAQRSSSSSEPSGKSTTWPSNPPAAGSRDTHVRRKAALSSARCACIQRPARSSAAFRRLPKVGGCLSVTLWISRRPANQCCSRAMARRRPSASSRFTISRKRAEGWNCSTDAKAACSKGSTSPLSGGGAP
mmetsp:Transcript_45320/g.114766  ORF Transcript_45320/g.114766 Transcript_45320/m.114766 type:complete len:293 (-) Transcript_45320:61-939(-)